MPSGLQKGTDCHLLFVLCFTYSIVSFVCGNRGKVRVGCVTHEFNPTHEGGFPPSHPDRVSPCVTSGFGRRPQ